MNIVKTVDLTKTYNSGVEVHALSNVNFEMDKGDLVAIIGDSGSGKSTLLHLLAGVDKPTSGDIFIQDKNITKFNNDEMTIFRRRNIGVVYQFFNLIPNINVRKNILITRPAIILADEPTGNLDRKNSEEITGLFRLVNKRLNSTIMIITHDEKVANACDKVYKMIDGRLSFLGDESYENY